MQGANYPLYEELNKTLGLNVIASGGVSDIEGIKILKDFNIYGAIIGKAYYVKAISLKQAIEVANDN
jgi:phosphoribosylformimino-5-aminoimidazole carboxamide ribotide isomerase